MKNWTLYAEGGGGDLTTINMELRAKHGELGSRFDNYGITHYTLHSKYQHALAWDSPCYTSLQLF
jgi:hypothetical protein